MSVKIDNTKAPPVLTIDGSLTKYDVAEIKAALDEVNPEANLSVDLSNVEECDTAGTQLLISLRKTFDEAGGGLELGECSSAVVKAADRIGLSLTVFKRREADRG